MNLQQYSVFVQPDENAADINDKRGAIVFIAVCALPLNRNVYRIAIAFVR